MTEPAVSSLLSVDVGNTRVKIGRFDRSLDCEAAAQSSVLPVAGPPLPPPAEVRAFEPLADDAELEAWLSEQGYDAVSGGVRVIVASVNRLARDWIVAALERFSDFVGVPVQILPLTPDRLPLEVGVPEAEKVGIDRLAGAAAANRLRRPGKPAVVVDLGTAITVDLLSAEGAFTGGAILPGVAMAARALHQQTDLLPQRPLHELEHSPDAVGTSTADAIDAGLFWGAVGAVRELIARQSDRLTEPPQVFVTGGAAPSVARLLGGPDVSVRHVPDLVLSGIALAIVE